MKVRRLYYNWLQYFLKLNQMAEHITDQNFQEKVLQAGRPVLVDFYATWCGPCKVMAPVIDELAKEKEGTYDVYKLDVDQNPDTAGKYGVMSIPTILFFKNGEEVERKVGVQGKEVLMQQLEGMK